MNQGSEIIILTLEDAQKLLACLNELTPAQREELDGERNLLVTVVDFQSLVRKIENR